MSTLDDLFTKLDNINTNYDINKKTINIIILYLVDLQTFYIDNIEAVNIDYGNYLTYVGNLISEKRMEKIVKVLHKCKCCKRHQKKRPSTYQYKLGFSGNYDDDEDSDSTDTEDNSISDEEICNCRCRHRSREMCRIKRIMNEINN